MPRNVRLYGQFWEDIRAKELGSFKEIFEKIVMDSWKVVRRIFMLLRRLSRNCSC